MPQPKPAEIPPWLRWLGRMLEPVAPFAGWIFWGLVIAGAAVILLLIARHLFHNRRQRDVTADAQGDVAQWRPDEKVARALLAEADMMAAAGRYEEAARLLLHRCLEDIARHRPRFLRPALTSREIGSAGDLPHIVRDAFAAMAAPVERSLFGGRGLERRDWEDARSAYGSFALPGAWK